MERVGDVAYKLQLLAGAKIHDVFHVGLLKKFSGEPPLESGSLPPIRHGRACPELAAVLKSRLAHGRHELLVSWKGQAAASATWMDLEEFQHLYPAFQLED
jgi:hypothetical protein